MMSDFLANLARFRAVRENFYLTDFFDIFIIAILIYAALLLFKRTRSITILAGVAISVIVYGLSQVFNLTLTSVFLRSFFGVFFLVLVIIFQEEVRRFFEMVAVWGTRGRTYSHAVSRQTIVESIVQAISSLARHKVGALVVLVGNENIARHLDGGIDLDGIVSQELIESIFDPNSPGHDGAMIVAGNRISTIGAQLPLSHNLEQIEKAGTRHSAALGIAERSDALAVVVSEEKGTISIAEKNSLEHIKTASDLADQLRAFYREKYPETTYSLWQKVFTRNLIEKIVAIGISLGLWFFLVYQTGTVQRNFTVPISFRDLPQGFVIEEFEPKTVTVTLENRGGSFDINENSISVSIDARNLSSGTKQIRLTSGMVQRPFAFNVVNISPTELSLTANRYELKEIPIEATVRGNVAPGYQVTQILVSPGSVRALVPDSIETPSRILTAPLDVAGLNTTVNRNGSLRLPEGVRLEQNANLDLAITIVIRQR